MNREPKARRKIKVENLKHPEREVTPEQADQARGGMGDGSVHFVTGTSTSSSRIIDGTSNT